MNIFERSGDRFANPELVISEIARFPITSKYDVIQFCAFLVEKIGFRYSHHIFEPLPIWRKVFNSYTYRLWLRQNFGDFDVEAKEVFIKQLNKCQRYGGKEYLMQNLIDQTLIACPGYLSGFFQEYSNRE